MRRGGSTAVAMPSGMAVDDSRVLAQASDVDLVKRRRRQIVEAAVALFSREGFYRTTVQQVARKADISAGLIYHYARTKEDVLLLALLHVLEIYQAEVPKAVEGVKDPMDRLYVVLSTFTQIVADNLDATVLVYRSTKSLPPPQRELVKRSEMESNEIIASAIRDCVKAGIFRKVDVDFATYQFVMNIHTWALKNWHFKERYKVSDYVLTSMDFFVHAMATPQGLKKYQKRNYRTFRIRGRTAR